MYKASLESEFHYLGGLQRVMLMKTDKRQVALSPRFYFHRWMARATAVKKFDSLQTRLITTVRHANF